METKGIKDILIAHLDCKYLTYKEWKLFESPTIIAISSSDE